MGCGSPEVLLDCEQPEPGDLEGYCILGEADGAQAALADRSACVSTPSEPRQVAHGPGGCDAPSAAVLEAEQAEYERCWAAAYDDALDRLVEGADTACEPIE